MTSSVLLIDDHPLFRSGVAQLVQGDPELSLAGQAGDGPTGIALALSLRPDLVLIDLNMKQMNGIEVLRALKAAGCPSRCVMLTVSDDGKDVLEAMRAGADGYLLKDLEPEELCLNIKRAVLGSTVIESCLAGLLVDALKAPPQVDVASLTELEREILGLLVDGMSNKQIARVLGIADTTVKVHIKHLLRKLNVRSRLEAAVWGFQNPQFRTQDAAPRAPMAG